MIFLQTLMIQNRDGSNSLFELQSFVDGEEGYEKEDDYKEEEAGDRIMIYFKI